MNDGPTNQCADKDIEITGQAQTTPFVSRSGSRKRQRPRHFDEPSPSASKRRTSAVIEPSPNHAVINTVPTPSSQNFAVEIPVRGSTTFFVNGADNDVKPARRSSMLGNLYDATPSPRSVTKGGTTPRK